MSYRKIKVQLMVLLFTLVLNQSDAQTENWQIGIGMSPGEEVFDPWYLIMKRSLNTKWNLRSGLGFSSRKYEEEVYSRYDLVFNYIKITREYDIRLLLGLEYRMKWRGLEFFTAGDLLLGKSRSYENLKDEFPIYGDDVDPHSQLYDVAQFDKVKVFSVGGRFSFGMEYFITRNASVVVESGSNNRFFRTS
ncbi:MAG: hypothetical protein IPL46_14490 [Saprospiraceae bacterium]|nr:hypothetical protein [Saprospiraceae bacterium]